MTTIVSAARVGFLNALVAFSLLGQPSFQPTPTVQSASSRQPTKVAQLYVPASTSPAWLDLSVRAFTGLVALINFIFVIWVFRRARSDRREDQKRAVDLFWFQEIILKPHKDRIITFFADADSWLVAFQQRLPVVRQSDKVSECENACREATRQFNDALKAFSDAFVDQVVVTYPQLGQELREGLEATQDLFVESIDSWATPPDYEKVRADLREQKHSFLRKLYAAHQQPK